MLHYFFFFFIFRAMYILKSEKPYRYVPLSATNIAVWAKSFDIRNTNQFQHFWNFSKRSFLGYNIIFAITVIHIKSCMARIWQTMISTVIFHDSSWSTFYSFRHTSKITANIIKSEKSAILWSTVCNLCYPQHFLSCSVSQFFAIFLKIIKGIKI